ncbi:MAG: 4-oxalomesaconate tautomerase [Candidatus Odyssella sp.]|nr:4-oxalomesaconate tautomerase [Candidatus Odyssella sp.]
MAGQTKIPCVMMRGGTSKGAYFLARDLPADAAVRDRVLLAAMGSPDARQIDGMGGAHPLTSKVAIVSKSQRADADIDYLFAQVVVNEPKVDVSPACGNILAGVGPFAIEAGLVKPAAGETRVRIYMVNTKSLCTATVKTPGGEVSYEGETRIAGVPGTAAPILLDFEGIAGSSCGALLPTGNARDTIEGVPVTCIDNGMPVVVFAAKDVGRTGYETPAALNADMEAKARIEAIRLRAGPMMKLGDVTKKVVPKMTLIAPAREGGAVATRTFIPHVCHEAIGVLGAVSVATACVLPGSATEGIAAVPAGTTKVLSVEHPTGEFTVQLETVQGAGGIEIRRAALLRTARRLFDGNVLVPRGVWDGG